MHHFSRSFIFTVGIVVFYAVILAIPFHLIFTGSHSTAIAKNLGRIIESSLIIIVVIFVIRRLRLQQLAFVKFLRLEKPVYLLVPFLFPLPLALGNFNNETFGLVSTSSLFIFLTLMIRAIGEEVTFRGLLQAYYWRKSGKEYSALTIACWSSLVFSLMHCLSLMKYSYLDVASQVIVAFYFGMFFSGLLIRLGNVWLVGILHGLVNIAFNFRKIVEPGASSGSEVTIQEGLMSALTYVLILLPVLVIGILLLRKARMR